MTDMQHLENQKPGICLNCDAAVQEDFLYCARCSQRLRSSKITVGSLFKEFVSSMFNFDSRFFQSFLKLLIPGKLTIEYISGKRKRYFNPVRLFIFSMVFHFAVIAYISKDLQVQLGDINHSSDLAKNVAEYNLLQAYDSLINVIPIDTTQEMDSLRSHLFENVINGMGDSINIQENGIVQLSGTTNNRSYHIDDILNMDESKFLDHYKIEGFKQRLFTRQTLRMYRNPQALFGYFIGNLLWAVVLSILFLTLVMKLLYIRKKRFFVEHLILLMHIHSFIFIMVGLALIIDRLLNNAIGPWLWTTSGIAAIYFFWSMYKYYGQGFFKTFMKYLFVLLSYLFIITIFVGLILMISLLVF